MVVQPNTSVCSLNELRSGAFIALVGLAFWIWPVL